MKSSLISYFGDVWDQEPEAPGSQPAPENYDKTTDYNNQQRQIDIDRRKREQLSQAEEEERRRQRNQQLAEEKRREDERKRKEASRKAQGNQLHDPPTEYRNGEKITDQGRRQPTRAQEFISKQEDKKISSGNTGLIVATTALTIGGGVLFYIGYLNRRKK